MDKFSERFGLVSPNVEITVRDDAPEDLRCAIVDIAYEAGLDPHNMRNIVCRTLRVREDRNNWSPYPNIDDEVRTHLDNCQWFEVYDIIEATYTTLAEAANEQPLVPVRPTRPELRPEYFTDEINKVFYRQGIGWQLVDGQIQMRGPEAFRDSIKDARETLLKTGRGTAANEIHQALLDLSRRPEPDVTGAIQHGLASLECVMRDVCDDSNPTLGALLSSHSDKIPAPLDQAVEKIWGFASGHGRHIREGREPSIVDARLVVHVASAVAEYLVLKFDIDNKM